MSASRHAAPAFVQRPRRRLSVLVVLVGVLVLVGTSIGAAAAASTPVTVGYRDDTYGGGTFRPSADKPQSKLWYTDGSWFGGLFYYNGTLSRFYINKLDRATHTWNRTGTFVDTRDKSHGDYLWYEGGQTLWVASAHDGAGGAIGVDDQTRIYKFTYSAATHTYTAVSGFPKTIPNTAGGKRTVTIARDSGGRLWTVWPDGNQVRYSISNDGGVTWSTPAQVPVQAGNTIKVNASGVSTDIASVVAFGDSVGVAWSDHDALPSSADDGYYFATIAAGTGVDPTNAANWTNVKLPTLVPGANPTETADNHINLKATPDGRVFMVGKTGKDTAGCATNQTLPLIELFDRSTSGTWTAHLVSTVGDCSTRPQVLISDQLDMAFVLLTAPNGGGVTYLKSAPLTGTNAFKFREGPTSAIEHGVPIIKSATETSIDDPSSTKQVVSDSSDIVVLANNLTNTGTSGVKYYLHNEIAIGASDSTPPTGTVAIAGGAATTRTSAVTVNVPATDAGSGVAFVRLSNDAGTTGGVLTNGQSFPYASTHAWTLAAGDGTRSVYVQWRDGDGHWSTPISDSIVVDGTAPTGSVTIAGGAAKTASRTVSLSLSASDGTGTGVTTALLSNGSDPATATSVAFAGPTGTYSGWTIPAGDGTKTVSVWYRDAAGNLSSARTDTIVLDQTPPTKGTVTIDGGATSTASTAGTIALTNPAGADAVQARASNQSNMTGAVSVPVSGSTAWNLTAGGDGIRAVYVQWADALGNWSTPASDTIYLDTVPPVGSVSINAGAAWTKSTAATLTFPGTDTDVTQVRVGSSANLSAVGYRAWSPGMTLPFTLPSGDGQKTVYAQFKDVGGRQSAVVSDTIGLDTVKPTAPTSSNRVLGGTVTTGIATRIYWAAGSDAGSGVAGYLVQRSINSGAWATVARTTASTRSVVFQLSSGKTYRFRFLTLDRAGNISSWRYGPSIKTRNASEASTTIRYRGTWSWIRNTAFMGGKARGATSKGASATFTFTGNRVAWLSRTGPTQGTANIYINGKYVTKVNLYSATTTYKQMVFRRSFSTVATRTLKIVVSSSSPKKVVIDGFFVLR